MQNAAIEFAFESNLQHNAHMNAALEFETRPETTQQLSLFGH